MCVYVLVCKELFAAIFERGGNKGKVEKEVPRTSRLAGKKNEFICMCACVTQPIANETKKIRTHAYIRFQHNIRILFHDLRGKYYI